MKIKVATEIGPGENAVDCVLKSRGLNRAWLTAGKNDLLDGRELRNFESGSKLLKDSLDKNIAIYVDSDTDGFCSSAIMYLWLKDKYKKEAKIIIPEGKVHGIIASLIPEDIDLLIVPDASSSERVIHKELFEKGIKTLILDHHEFDSSKDQYAIIINPHHPECPYKNKGLSGTGVVYKFIEGIDRNDGVDFYSKYIDLAAIATVADSMDLKEMDNKALVNIGLKEIHNPYFKEAKKADNRVKDKTMDAIIVGFYLVPTINALIRLGSIEEKIDLFNAIVGITPPQSVIANLKRVKSKQDNDKEPIITRIALNLQSQPGGLDHAIIFTNTPAHTPKSITGVIAGQLTNYYLRPVFLGREEDGNFIGSSRNVKNSVVANLKDFCEESGLFNWVAGHQSAFGFSISKENINKFLVYCDLNLPPFELIYYVDFELKGDNPQIVEDLVELKNHYGPGFPEVQISQTLYIKPSDLRIMGSKKNTLGITKGDMDYIYFNLKDALPLNPAIWEIIGKPGINEYNGISKPQIQLVAWAIRDMDL